MRLKIVLAAAQRMRMTRIDPGDDLGLRTRTKIAHANGRGLMSKRPLRDDGHGLMKMTRIAHAAMWPTRTTMVSPPNRSLAAVARWNSPMG